MKIIPAIDLMDGHCVRLVQGDFESSKTYSDDPLEVAKQFEADGAAWLHIVDLDGARTGTPVHVDVLASIKSKTNLKVDFGGGLREESAIISAFDAGADQVTVGSAAMRRPDTFERWLDELGPRRFILAADVKDGFVAVAGWTETSSVPLLDALADFQHRGLEFVMITDVGRDGTLAGPATDTYRDVKAAFPDLFLIASGGVGSYEDLELLESASCDAAIVGKALYEGRIELSQC